LKENSKSEKFPAKGACLKNFINLYQGVLFNMSKVEKISGKKTKKRNIYSQAVKNEVRRLLGEQKNPQEIANLLGISVHVIKKWKYQNVGVIENKHDDILSLKKEIKHLNLLVNYLLKKGI